MVFESLVNNVKPIFIHTFDYINLKIIFNEEIEFSVGSKYELPLLLVLHIAGNYSS